MKRVAGVAAVLSLIALQSCGGDAQDNGPPAPSDGGAAGAAGSNSRGGTPARPPPIGDAGAPPIGGHGPAGAPAIGMGGILGDGGTGDGGTGGAPMSPDVNGVVRAGPLPVPNAVVIVNGVVTASDAQGRFSVVDVAERYDLIVLLPDLKYALAWDGLVTREPGLNVGFLPTDRQASLVGKLSGGVGFPSPGGEFAIVAYRSDNSDGFGQQLVRPSATGYDFPLAWTGQAADQGELFALQWKEDAFNPTEYTGFAQKKVSAAAGTIVANNLALTDVKEILTTGTTTVPNGWDFTGAFIYCGPIGIGFYLNPGPFSLPFPAVDQPLAFALRAEGPQGVVGVRAPRPASGPWNIELGLPGTPTVPVPDATGISTATTFAWAGDGPDQVASVIWKVGGWYVVRYSAETQMKIPDLAPYGFELPAGAVGSWELQLLSPASTIEDVLAIDAVAFDQVTRIYTQLRTSNPRLFTVAN